MEPTLSIHSCDECVTGGMHRFLLTWRCDVHVFYYDGGLRAV